MVKYYKSRFIFTEISQSITTMRTKARPCKWGSGVPAPDEETPSPDEGTPAPEVATTSPFPRLRSASRRLPPPSRPVFLPRRSPMQGGAPIHSVLGRVSLLRRLSRRGAGVQMPGVPLNGGDKHKSPFLKNYGQTCAGTKKFYSLRVV
jgi:hypothetical protein